ncbi:hypothetical protein HPP92_000047 [Vanilla planifolia]|uniref:WEB family protein n=1 Tax=Vanilla planifolia TaxID=51239 RepID=A0A835VK36_VANPL|nr:hypothetical protein HPP92_000047 [Vanilla planifolia]
MHAKHSPGSILVQLEKAKMNLTRSTSNMADVQATIESVKSKIQEEKALVEKTREKLSSKRTIISRLEDDLKQMKFMLQLTKKEKDTCNGDPTAISVEIKNLISQRGQFRQAAEAAKLEVLSLGSEIDQIKSGVKTAEIRWLAAKKMEQTAKAAEAVATAQSSILTNSNSTPCLANNEAVVLSMEEYAALTRKIEESDESLKGKMEVVMLEVERANQSKVELMAKIEEAETDLKTRKKFLEVALYRVEAANRGKLAVEEALRRWRTENVQKRRCIDNNAKFKNSYPGLHRRDPMMLDLNGLNLLNDDTCGLKHSLSIGEILSRKLMGPEDYDYDTARTEFSNAKVKVSLGQILNRRLGALSPMHGCEARSWHSSKRKKFGLMGFSHLLKNGRMRQKKSKKKKHIALPR